MNAEPKNDKDLPKTDPNMKRAFFKSGIFHFCIFLLALFGLPFIAKDPPEMVMPVSVEMAEIAEKTQTNKISEPKKVEKQPEIKKPEPPKQEPAKKVEAEEPPDLKPPEPPEALLEPEKEEEKEKPKPKPKEKPKPKPKEEPERDFNSLLKDLTPDEEEAPSQEEKTQVAPLGERLTVSELDSIRRQIEPCWNFPIGAKNAEDLVVRLRIEIGRDMRINKADVIDSAGFGNPALKAAEDSALRAVRNPRCSQLQGLPADKYERWQTIILNLDPSTVL